MIIIGESFHLWSQPAVSTGVTHGLVTKPRYARIGPLLSVCHVTIR